MQQVNLYLPEFRPRRVWCSLSQMVVITLLVLLAVAAASVWSTNYTASQQVALENDTQRLNQLQEQLDQALSRSRAQAPAENRIEQLREGIHRREQLLDVMRRQNLGNAEGFSAQVAGLARRLPDGLSLSHFALREGGQYVELAGRVREPQTVPLYLQQLRADPAFASVGFGVLNVAREPDHQGPGLTFSIQRNERLEGEQP